MRAWGPRSPARRGGSSTAVSRGRRSASLLIVSDRLELKRRIYSCQRLLGMMICNHTESSKTTSDKGEVDMTKRIWRRWPSITAIAAALVAAAPSGAQTRRRIAPPPNRATSSSPPEARAEHPRRRHQHFRRGPRADRSAPDRGGDRPDRLHAERLDQGNRPRPRPGHHDSRRRTRRLQRDQQSQRRRLCRRGLPQLARVAQLRLLRSRPGWRC